MYVSVYQSYVFANLIGLYLLVIGIIFATRSEYYSNILRSVKLTTFNIVVTGLFTVFIGLFLVEHHNVWVFKPRVLMTLISWVILIKGLLFILIPEQMMTLYYRWVTPKRVLVSSVIYIILGFIMVFDGARLLYIIQHP
jgi:uncharacterized membrane protein